MIGTYRVAKFDSKKTMALLRTDSQWLLDEFEVDVRVALCIDRGVC